MVKLIFDTVLTGHHLEYIHHIWNGAIERPNDKFVFAVPEKEWNSTILNKEWTKPDNVALRLLNDEEVAYIRNCNKGLKNWRRSRLAVKILKEVKANEIIMIILAIGIPFLPFLLPKKTKLSGIIYKIFLYDTKNKLKFIIDYLLYYIIAKKSNVKAVFMLNDSFSSNILNERFKTNKFICLPDPVVPMPKQPLLSLRERFGIKRDNNVFLHFGAMDVRKGTIDILKAILLLEKTDNSVFIFAGKINENIRNEFYSLYRDIEKIGIRIIVLDEFCSYEMLHNLCHTSDCILMPYHLTNLSSGVVGYASLHKIPVIGPSTGLIGRLINEYNLGITLDKINPTRIFEEIKRFKPYKIDCKYAKKNNVKSFISTILG